MAWHENPENQHGVSRIVKDSDAIETDSHNESRVTSCVWMVFTLTRGGAGP